VRAAVVVVDAPILDQDLGFGQAGEQLDREEFVAGVSEEPCKRGRKDQPCPRELTAGSIKKKMLLSGRSEATPVP
jgi:hypothetical protein